MALRGFLRWTGTALAAGGLLGMLLNLALTPWTFLPGVPFEDVAASPIFLWRQSLSAVTAVLLLFGSVGLYLSQATHAGRFAAVAFVAAFIGSALLVAWEWVDIFLIRDLALRAPDTLRLFEDAKGIHPYQLGGIIAAASFALGWIALAAASWRATPALRRGAMLVIGGFFAVPLLTAAFGPRWGGALGNIVLGSGWILLGWRVREHAGGV